MKFAVKYTPQAIKDLKKIDKSIAALIICWIEKNLIDCQNPYLHGKGLKANHLGEWCYRIGNYRILAEIDEETITILVLSVGHRGKVYGGH